MASESASRVRAPVLRSPALSFEGLLDRVEVRRVGWQQHEAGARSADGLADTGDLVGGEVVPHHDLARLERRGEELRDIGTERRTGHRPVQHEGHDEASAAQTDDEGGGAPVAVRCRIRQALAPRSPAVAADQVRAGASLVEEDEAGRVHGALPDAPVAASIRDVGSVPLGSPQRLFCAAGQAGTASPRSWSATRRGCRAP